MQLQRFGRVNRRVTDRQLIGVQQTPPKKKAPETGKPEMPIMFMMPDAHTNVDIYIRPPAE